MSSDEQKSQPLEDWIGADLDRATAFEVRRAYNGIVVLPSTTFMRDTVASNSQVLVFQNPEHFWSWFSNWLDRTKDQRT